MQTLAQLSDIRFVKGKALYLLTFKRESDGYSQLEEVIFGEHSLSCLVPQVLPCFMLQSPKSDHWPPCAVASAFTGQT